MSTRDGRWIPASALRVALVVAGALLGLLDVGADPWLVVAVVIAVIAAVVPGSGAGWGLILFLAAGRLHDHATLGWRLLVLIAGVHLLHVLSSLALALPWRARVAPAALLPALRRYLAIEVAVQLTAVLALLTLAPGHHGHRPLTAPVAGVVGAAALAGLALVLLRTPRSRS